MSDRRPPAHIASIDDELDRDRSSQLLAELVAAALDDVRREYPELSELRTEALAALLAAHRFERRAAIERGRPGRDWALSSSHLFSWLSEVEHRG